MKKILSFLLCFCCIFAFAVPVFAEENSGFTSMGGGSSFGVGGGRLTSPFAHTALVTPDDEIYAPAVDEAGNLVFYPSLCDVSYSLNNLGFSDNDAWCPINTLSGTDSTGNSVNYSSADNKSFIMSTYAENRYHFLFSSSTADNLQFVVRFIFTVPRSGTYTINYPEISNITYYSTTDSQVRPECVLCQLDGGGLYTDPPNILSNSGDFYTGQKMRYTHTYDFVEGQKVAFSWYLRDESIKCSKFDFSINALPYLTSADSSAVSGVVMDDNSTAWTYNNCTFIYGDNGCTIEGEGGGRVLVGKDGSEITEESDDDDDGGDDDSGGGIFGGLFDGLKDLLGAAFKGLLKLVADMIGDIFHSLADIITSAIDSLTQILDFGGDFKNFLSSFFSWLPAEIVTVLSAGVSLMIILAVIKFIRK